MGPKRQIITAVLVAFSFVLSVSTARAAEDVTILTEDYPPLNYVADGKLQGPSVEVVDAIRAELGIAREIKVYPWARAYKLTETEKNTALFSMTRSPTREDQFKWVGPLAEKKIGLFARRDSEIKLNSLDDARGYLIGVQKGGHGLDYLKERGFTNFDASTTPMANLKKLLKDRTDFWFASNATVAGNTRKLGLSSDELKLALAVDNSFMFIAFNKETDDTVIAAWQRAFDSLMESGFLREALEKYGLGDLHPTITE